MTMFEIILLIMAFVFCCIVTFKEYKQFTDLKSDNELNKANIDRLIDDYSYCQLELEELKKQLTEKPLK